MRPFARLSRALRGLLAFIPHPSSLIPLFLAACTALGPTSTPSALPPASATPLTPDPQGTAHTFLDLWQQGDYAGMYTLLSPLSQDSISLDDFADRYAATARTASLTQVEPHILSALKNGLTAQVLYEVNLHSAVVGTISRKIEMPLVYTGDRWAIAWTDALILPELADGHYLNVDYATPARANIYDRNGLGLAVQGEAVAIGVQPNLITDEPAVLEALASLLHLRETAIQAKYANARPDWYVPIGVASAEEVQARLGELAALGGVLLNRYTTRYYPYGGVAPQVIGYMSSITPEQLADYQARGYAGDERVGQAGLEAWAEEYLAGVRGATLYAVDAGGQVAATLAESQRQPGQAVYTTLDRELQLAAQQALEGFRGAAIILDPATGEVLAMVSAPAFDPNLFDPTNRNAADLEQVLADAGRPLLNRATQGTYPPASIFKVPMLAAALMSGLYTRDSTYTCTGSWNTLGPNAIKYDWTVSKGVAPHGPINLIEALAYSCDPYFYTVAYDLYQQDPNFMSEVAREFGLGEFTQVEQVAEARGLMPDPAWKVENIGEDWLPGDSVNMGIGQGYVLVTPLQIAQMMAAVRNGGTLLRPQLVHHIAPPGGEPSFQMEPIVNGRLPVTPEQLAQIQEALRGVTTLPKGTARHIFPNFEIPVAGKTGTAEDPAQGVPHAWFAGYTEANRPDKPDVVIVVVLENTGEGSDFAAPIFRRLAEIYFLGRAYSLYPWEAEFGEDATATPTP
jgi:penicillin-binding protein 2